MNEPGMAHAKTGGMGGAWVTYDSPKPPAVLDHYTYWGNPPPERSERCAWWVRQIERGWRPNRHVRRESYDSSAQWYGVYIWEWLHVIQPALTTTPPPNPSTIEGEQHG